jgi:hypothetical protein
MALRLTRQGGRLAAAGRCWLAEVEARAAFEHAQIASAGERLSAFEALKPV